MNYIDLLPQDIIAYIYELIEQSYTSYYFAFNHFLTYKYHCDLVIFGSNWKKLEFKNICI